MDIDKITELLRELAESGEAKIEVSFKLVREERKEDLKPARPYDTEKRLGGYRRIADFIGCSVGFVMASVKRGELRTYNIGRKLYAYEDEILEDLASVPSESATVRNIFKNKGYELQTIRRVVANV